MKKLILSLVILSSMMFASSYKYEITPMIGGVKPEGNMDIKNHLSYGLRFGINVEKTVIDQVELGYERSDKAGYRFTDKKTDIDRLFVNVLKYFPIKKNLSWYALAGAGYENLENHYTSNGDSGFVNYGVGLKYTFENDMALRAEIRHAVNFKNWDNNLFYSVGLSIPFGKKAEPAKYKPEPITPVTKPEPKPAPAPVVVGDDDHDGVNNNQDLCPNTPAGAKVDQKGCQLDSDNDGVVDGMDKCPNTPAGNVVTKDGCEKVIHLRVEFDFNKSNIKAMYIGKIKEVAKFLSINPGYKVILEGNTDSIGSKKYNIALSIRRADAVAAELEKLGVQKDRISTKGYGESHPIATNKTAEGRAQNRRVDAKFNKGE